MRLVGEIESRRRIRGATDPWQRVRLRVRVRKSGMPGVRLPAVLRDRRVTVVRETTAPENLVAGMALALSEEEGRKLCLEAKVPKTSVAIEGDVLSLAADPERGAILERLALLGRPSTIAHGHTRLAVRESREPVRGGASWEIDSRKGLWKTRFGRVGRGGDELVLREKAGKDKEHVVRTLAPVPGVPALLDRFEVFPAPPKKEEGKAKKGKKKPKKPKRPDLLKVFYDAALRPSGDRGGEECVHVPLHDRLLVWPYSPDQPRIWLMWAGGMDWHFLPGSGFAAATGVRGGAHVVLASPRDLDRLGTDSRRDHLAIRVKFRRRRPPFSLAVVHVVGDRIAFDGHRGFVLAARSPGSGRLHVVAFRQGLRAGHLSASVVAAGEERSVTLERQAPEGVPAFYAGTIESAPETFDEVAVRMAGETVRLTGAT